MLNRFKTVGVIGKGEAPHTCPLMQSICQLIQDFGSRVFVEESSSKTCDLLRYDCYPIADLGHHCDLVVVVGGDGTLLCAARHLAENGIPLVGVNHGRLGFLVDISPIDAAEKIENILSGDYTQESRYLLSTTVTRGDKIMHQADALNDVVLYKWNTAKMIEFDTYIDEHYLLTQRSDGMIISTPTGSTAFSLSGGGPIIHPSVNATLLVPICPHTLSNRPIVVHADSTVKITLKQGNIPEVQITSDGQASFTLAQEDTITIAQKPEPIHLLHPPCYDYFKVLRAKLHWGSPSAPQ